MLSYLFPGQGSQIRGMGADLFDQFPSLVKEADDVLGFSIKSLCLTDANQELNLTQYTQPAMYIVNALTYFKKIQENGPKPDYVAGHSLGEYNALLAAGVFDFVTGLMLVKKRGELMSHAKGGGMAAVLGMEKDALLHVLNNEGLANMYIANYNSPTQCILSGKEEDIKTAKDIFLKLKNVNFIPLRVSGAFHTPYMATAQSEFANYLHAFEFKVPTIPVIANATILPYHPLITKTNLANQITSPVNWVGLIRYLKSKNVSKFEEIGPGSVLTKLLAAN